MKTKWAEETLNPTFFLNWNRYPSSSFQKECSCKISKAFGLFFYKWTYPTNFTQLIFTY